MDFADALKPLACKTAKIAAVRVVFPWSTWPIVPTFTCGLVRSNCAVMLLCFKKLIKFKLTPNSSDRLQLRFQLFSLCRLFFSFFFFSIIFFLLFFFFFSCSAFCFFEVISFFFQLFEVYPKDNINKLVGKQKERKCKP